MRDFCQFLKPERFPCEPRCTAGINFASVGPGRARCRVCPLAEQDDLPLCPYLAVYTRLKGDVSTTARIEVEFACLADAATLPAAQCALCPERPQEGHLSPGTQIAHEVQRA